jgi:hypothetical protein
MKPRTNPAAVAVVAVAAAVVVVAASDAGKSLSEHASQS